MTTKLFSGLLLVVVGAILLMNTMDYLPWSVWESALNYWPVLLIGLGLQVALSRWRFPGLALAILVALLLGAIFPYPSSGVKAPWQTALPNSAPRILKSGEEWRVPLGPATSFLDLSLTAPSLDLTLKGDAELGAADPGSALSARISWDKREPETQMSYDREGQIASVTIGSNLEGADLGRQLWDIRLNRSLGTSIFVTGEVCDATCDFSQVFLDSMIVNCGVLRLDLKLGLTGQESSLEVSGGVGNLVLSVPENAGVKVYLTGPLSLVSDLAAQGLLKTGDTWMTPGYDDASTRINVRMLCGTGKVTLRKTVWD